MKRSIFTIFAIMSAAGVLYAALDASLLQTAVLVPKTDVAIGTNQTFSAVDKMSFTGVAGVVAILGANTGSVATVTLQSSATGTSDWVNISGTATEMTGTNGLVQTIPYDTTGGSRYIRVAVTNATAIAPITVIINSYK
jgi:hypothetical protein